MLGRLRGRVNQPTGAWQDVFFDVKYRHSHRAMEGSMYQRCAALAVDIGGPIIEKKRQPTARAIWAITLLVQRRFGVRTHLISQCSVETEAWRREWLEEHRFFDLTGVLRQHVHFCRELSEKSEICSELGITHFVENHPAVLRHIRTVPHLYLFHPDAEECQRHPQLMQYVFDPHLHTGAERVHRPIRLIHGWRSGVVRLIQKAPIFRVQPSSQRVTIL